MAELLRLGEIPPDTTELLSQLLCAENRNLASVVPLEDS